MRDYSKYEKTPVLFSGAEKKFEIIIDGYRYIVKFQKNSEVGLIFNYVSEYLGSHIFQLLGIPVQETFLGTYEGRKAAALSALISLVREMPWFRQWTDFTRLLKNNG